MTAAPGRPAPLISLQIVAAALVAVLVPGTGVIHALAAGLGQGRRAALAAPFG